MADQTTSTQTLERQQTQLLPPYRVVLHNDDVNTFDHVILTTLKLTPLPLPEVVTKVEEADRDGRSVLLVTNRERGELYVEQFATFNLTVTCEPDA